MAETADTERRWDRDMDRKVSDALLEGIERASRYSEPITLDCSAAADVWGEITRLRADLEAAREAIRSLSNDSTTEE